MDDMPIAGRDEARQMFQIFLGQYDAPAFVRRAREAEGTWQSLVEHGRSLREPLLEMVKLRLGMLHALAGSWSRLRELVEGDEDVDLLRRLHDEFKPALRAAPDPTDSRRALRRALVELCESLARFNRIWQREILQIDLGSSNAVREDYNRYYVLEKECALGSARVARQGFQRLPPVTHADLIAALPPLPLPRLKP